MKVSPKYFPFLFVSLTSACAPYPLSQDTSGYNTYQIVANIRCEARDAIRASAISYLKYYPEIRTKNGMVLADYLKDNPLEFETANINLLTGDSRQIFAYYKNSQIAYEFSLRGTEANTQGFDLGLERSFGLRKDTLGFKTEAQRSRDMTRSFFIWDKFEDLIKVNDEYCSNGKSVNIVYPITGTLPISDLIMNYIEMNSLGILANKSSGSTRPTIVGTEELPAIPSMGDTIIFKTRLDGNMSPNFNYNPAGLGLLVSSLALRNDNYREDTHTLTITVSTAPEKISYSEKSQNRAKRPADNQSRLSAAINSVNSQRTIRLENSIINLSNSLSRIAQ